MEIECREFFRPYQIMNNNIYNEFNLSNRTEIKITIILSVFYFRPVRRFFCLLVTFDFLFTGLLWVITVIIAGKPIEESILKEIVHYQISSSMFDIVVSFRYSLKM